LKPYGSIRRRLFFQLAGVAALLSLAFFLVVQSVAERAAEGTQDDILGASATAIADSLRSEEGGITLDLPYSALSMLGTVSEDRVLACAAKKAGSRWICPIRPCRCWAR